MDMLRTRSIAQLCTVAARREIPQELLQAFGVLENSAYRELASLRRLARPGSYR